jgi:hypothetical protein
MKKLGLMLGIVLVVLVGTFLWYVYPQEKLDLAYSSFAVSDKLKEMMTNRRLEFHLTQSDINNLLKKETAAHSLVNKNIKVTGAKFELNQDLLIAHINLMYNSWLPIGTISYYRLTWDAPILRIVPLYTKIRNWNVPDTLLRLPVQEVSIGSFLPSFLTVRQVSFEGDSIAIFLRFS